MFGWLQNRRRARLQEAPSPAHWAERLARTVPLYGEMPEGVRGILEARTRVLMAEKYFEGCGGFEITDDVRLTISATAALLLFPEPVAYFPLLKSIVVYPTGFTVTDEAYGEDGVVSVMDEERVGESWAQGVVVLAWDEVEESYANLKDGYNVILHEFAHQVDFADGVSDGAPEFGDAETAHRYGPVMQAQYDAFRRELNRGKRTIFDEYGAEDPTEFFAVVTETFFEAPKKVSNHYPELYALLTKLYAIDPLSW